MPTDAAPTAARAPFLHELEAVRAAGPSIDYDLLSDAVRERGGDVVEGLRVTRIRDHGSEVAVVGTDVAVLANGAWLNGPAVPFGVPAVVQAGRGYGFTLR